MLILIFCIILILDFKQVSRTETILMRKFNRVCCKVIALKILPLNEDTYLYYKYTFHSIYYHTHYAYYFC